MKPAADQLPPHDLGAEKGLLGCFLAGTSAGAIEVMDECRAAGVGADWFYALQNRVIWEALVEMDLAREPVDLTTLLMRLRSSQRIAQTEGLGYIASLPDTTPSAANAPYYIEVLQGYWGLRRVIQAGSAAIKAVYSPDASAKEIAAKLSCAADSVTEAMLVSGGEAFGVVNRGADTQATLSDIEARFNLHGQGKLAGIPTGLSDMDYITQGWQESEYAALCGRPGDGKSAMAFKFAHHAAVHRGEPTAILSLEMTKMACYRRLYSFDGRIHAKRLRSGSLTDEDIAKLPATMARIKAAPLFVIDGKHGVTVQDIRSILRRMKDQHGIKLVFIDYISLILPPRKGEKRSVDISDISTGLKRMFQQLNMSGVVLAQLRRPKEGEKVGRPKTSEIAETDQIFRDADMVAMIYRKRTAEDPKGEDSELVIGKQRDGETDIVPLRFIPQYATFEAVEKHPEY